MECGGYCLPQEWWGGSSWLYPGFKLVVGVSRTSMWNFRSIGWSARLSPCFIVSRRTIVFHFFKYYCFLAVVLQWFSSSLISLWTIMLKVSYYYYFFFLYLGLTDTPKMIASVEPRSTNIYAWEFPESFFFSSTSFSFVTALLYLSRLFLSSFLIMF